MDWSNWAKSQKQGFTEVQTRERLGGISSGCFWRMIAKNIAPNDRNLKKMASAKGMFVWELQKEVHEMSNEKAAKSKNFAA